MVNLDSLTIRLPIIALASIGIVVVDYLYDLGEFPQSAIFFILGSGIAAFACLLAYLRAGVRGSAFWFTLASGYVLLSPWFAYSFGYGYYSDLGREYQTLNMMSIAILEGSLATLILAAAMNSGSISAGGVGEKSLRLRFGPRTDGIWLLLCCVSLVGFAWLATPGPIIGFETYQEVRGDRFSDVRFAGDAWMLFSVLAVYFYLGIRRVKGAFLVRMLFFLSIAASIAWIFLHGRRSEPLGYMLFLYCILSSSRRMAIVQPGMKRLKLPDFVNMQSIALVLLVLMFAAMGYFRTTLSWQFGKVDYLQPPGGGGNNLLGYVSTFDILHHSSFGIYPGETYVNQIIDLPPEFMGFTRAPDAYAILSQKVNLVGGQFWLMEPLMNFGGAGLALYSLVISWLGSRSIRIVRRCLFEDGNLHAFLQGGIFIALMFRTLWYGPSAAINGAIMALLAGGGIFLLDVLGGTFRRKKYLPQTG